MATELTKLPIVLCEDMSTVDQQPQRSIGTETDEEAETSASIPSVDKWIEKTFISLTHYLDSILDVSIVVYDRVLNLVVEIINKTKDNIHHLRRVMYLSTLVEGDTTTVNIDLMLPQNEVQFHNGVPVIVATGPQRKIKKLCCTPVRYIPV